MVGSEFSVCLTAVQVETVIWTSLPGQHTEGILSWRCVLRPLGRLLQTFVRELPQIRGMKQQSTYRQHFTQRLWALPNVWPAG